MFLHVILTHNSKRTKPLQWEVYNQESIRRSKEGTLQFGISTDLLRDRSQWTVVHCHATFYEQAVK